VIHLVAVAYDDGYAFVREGDALYSVRPPFSAKRLASESSAERAITGFGFERAEGPFKDWTSLIDHLKGELIRRREEAGAHPDTKRIRQLVERAPKRIVETFLEKIEHELIPNKEWKAVMSLLTSLLRNKAVECDASLLRRCADLQSRSLEEQNSRTVGLEELEEEALRIEFPFGWDRYGEDILRVTKYIRRDGQIFFGSPSTSIGGDGTAGTVHQ
jgi:hypothetical protein